MVNDTKWVHFVGICSPAVSGLAAHFKNIGWKVTGSDKDVYPPASIYLESHHIPVTEGFSKEHIDQNIDLTIVGGGAFIMQKNNEEVNESLKMNIKTIGWPQFVGENVVKENSIVVAGTWGKTTTSSLLAYVLKALGENPTYVLGGYPVDFSDPVAITDSQFSIVEGDEHPSVLYWDDKSKFMYYKPKYLILTSVKWDHFNIFPTEESYVKRFTELVQSMGENGVVYAKRGGENVEKVVANAKCRVHFYDHEYSGLLSVAGKFNYENASAVFKLCTDLGYDKNTVVEAIGKFRGVKRRMEKRFEDKNFTIIEDFGQLPDKVNTVLTTLKSDYPEYKLLLVFDPHASVLQTRESLNSYQGKFAQADKVIVRRVHLSGNKDQRVTGPDIVYAVGKNSVYIPLDDDIVNNIADYAKSNRLVMLFCSSGSWNGLIENVINKLKYAN